MNKLFAILLASFLFECPLHSQNWLWAKNATGAGTGEGWATSADSHGNVFITGGFSSPTITFGSVTLTNFGAWNIFIAKYDPNGNVLWAKNPIGSGSDGGLAISTDASGNVFLTGWFTSPTLTFGSTVLAHAGSGYDVFIAKYDPNGNELWAKKAGGLNDDGGISICTDPNGNALITGYFKSSSMTFDSTVLANAGVYNIFIAKYDSNGNLLWANGEGGTAVDQGYGVSTDPVGNVFVTGEFSSSSLTFGTSTLTNAGSYDVFVAKYDPNGNALWARSAGNYDDDEGLALSADLHGNVFVTGFFSSPTLIFDTVHLTNAGGPWHDDIFVAKYDPAGNLLWAHQAGGTSSDCAGSICADAAGNAFVSGRAYSPGFTYDTIYICRPPNSVDPMFVAKYNASGHVLCAVMLGSGGDDQSGVSVDPFGNAYITGDYYGNPFVLGSDTLPLPTAENVFLAKYICCGSNAPLTVSASSDTICAGSVTTLNVTGGYQFGDEGAWKWHTGDCVGSVVGIGSSINISPGSSITYFVSGEGYCNQTGCDSISVKVNVTPKASCVAEYVADCSGITGYFKNESSQADNYVWQFSDATITNQVNANHVFNFNSATSVTLIALNNNGCKDILTLNNNFNSFADLCKLSIPNIFTPNSDGINDEFKINSSYDISECTSIVIFDRWGKAVYRAQNSMIKWDGRTVSDLKATSGVYFYILRVNELEYKGTITLLD